jgi:hypothetical protein
LPACSIDSHEGLKRDVARWAALPTKPDWVFGTTVLEMRDCPQCHSTLSRLVAGGHGSQNRPSPIEDDASLGEGVPNPIRSPRPRLCYLQLDSLDRESPKPDSSGQLRLSPANQSAGGANLGRAD